MATARSRLLAAVPSMAMKAGRKRTFHAHLATWPLAGQGGRNLQVLKRFAHTNMDVIPAFAQIASAAHPAA